MIGTVLGELRLEKSVDACREHRWVQVRVDTQIYEAVDLVGCQKGECVMLLSGPTAQRISMGCPGDWGVAAVLPGTGISG